MAGEQLEVLPGDRDEVAHLDQLLLHAAEIDARLQQVGLGGHLRADERLGLPRVRLRGRDRAEHHALVRPRQDQPLVRLHDLEVDRLGGSPAVGIGGARHRVGGELAVERHAAVENRLQQLQARDVVLRTPAGG